MCDYPKSSVLQGGVMYENSRTPGRSVVGKIYHTGLPLLNGRGRLRNSDLDRYFWISLKCVPLLLKHIGLPLKLFQLQTKVNIGFKHSTFSQGSALFSSYPTPSHLFGHSFSRSFLTCLPLVWNYAEQSRGNVHPAVDWPQERALSPREGMLFCYHRHHWPIFTQRRGGDGLVH